MRHALQYVVYILICTAVFSACFVCFGYLNEAEKVLERSKLSSWSQDERIHFLWIIHMSHYSCNVWYKLIQQVVVRVHSHTVWLIVMRTIWSFTRFGCTEIKCLSTINKVLRLCKCAFCRAIYNLKVVVLFTPLSSVHHVRSAVVLANAISDMCDVICFSCWWITFQPC